MQCNEHTKVTEFMSAKFSLYIQKLQTYNNMQSSRTIYWKGNKISTYLLRIKQVVIQCVLSPNYSHIFVSSRIGVTRSCAGLPPEKPVQIWPCKFKKSQLIIPWTLKSSKKQKLQTVSYGKFCVNHLVSMQI